MLNNESIFFIFLGISIGVYILYLLVKKTPLLNVNLSAFLPDNESRGQHPNPSLSNYFQFGFVEIFYTIVAVVIYQLLSMIPAPRIIYPVGSYSISHWGVMPYLAACVFLQVISILIPPLRAKFFDGEAGRQIVSKYTLISSFAITLIFSVSLTWWAPINGQKLIFYAIMPAYFMIGFSIALGLALFITKKGIAHGITVLFAFALLTRAWDLLNKIYSQIHSIQSILLLIPAIIVIILISIYLTNWKKTFHFKKK